MHKQDMKGIMKFKYIILLFLLHYKTILSFETYEQQESFTIAKNIFESSGKIENINKIDLEVLKNHYLVSLIMKYESHETIRLIKLLLELGTDTEHAYAYSVAENPTALSKAVLHNNFEAISLLLDYGANPKFVTFPKYNKSKSYKLKSILMQKIQNLFNLRKQNIMQILPKDLAQMVLVYEYEEPKNEDEMIELVKEYADFRKKELSKRSTEISDDYLFQEIFLWLQKVYSENASQADVDMLAKNL